MEPGELTIPILLHHDRSKVIGVMQTDPDKPGLFVRFTSDVQITRDMLFEIFGNAGVRVMEAEMNDDGLNFTIKSGQILEWSMSPQIEETTNAT